MAFSKVSGVLGTSAAAVKKWQIREAVMCYMLWSAGTHSAPLPAAELALAGLPCLHGCPLWNRVWNQIDHDF